MLPQEIFGDRNQAAAVVKGRFQAVSQETALCMQASKERKMNLQFYLGLGLVLLLFGLCYYFRKENK
jgi:hypothetical protein